MLPIIGLAVALLGLFLRGDRLTEVRRTAGRLNAPRKPLSNDIWCKARYTHWGVGTSNTIHVFNTCIIQYSTNIGVLWTSICKIN